MKAFTIAFLTFGIWMSVLWTLFCASIFGIYLILAFSRQVTPQNDTQSLMITVMLSATIALIGTGSLMATFKVVYEPKI
jgi:hypothetical protein